MRLVLSLALLPAAACAGVPPATTITNVRIIDGTGAPARSGAVRIVGDTIVAVGELAPQRGDAVVDGGGSILAPGFIDTHSHHDAGLDLGLGRWPAGRNCVLSWGPRDAGFGPDLRRPGRHRGYRTWRGLERQLPGELELGRGPGRSESRGRRGEPEVLEYPAYDLAVGDERCGVCASPRTTDR